MQSVNCPVCQNELNLMPGTTRKKGKPCLMLICPVNQAHFRAFINDQDFIKQVMESLDGMQV